MHVNVIFKVFRKKLFSLETRRTVQTGQRDKQLRRKAPCYPEFPFVKQITLQQMLSICWV